MLLAALIAAMPALAEDGDVSIDAHRLGVMVDQSDAALHLLSKDWPVAQTSAEDSDDPYAALVSAARRFERLRAQACQANLAGPQFCGMPYDPAWLNAKPADLHAATEEAQAHIQPFWQDVCTRAKTPCPME